MKGILLLVLEKDLKGESLKQIATKKIAMEPLWKLEADH